MGLLDDLTDNNNLIYKNRSQCTVCALIASVSDKEAAALKDALANPQVAGSKLSLVLRSNGYRIGKDSIWRHRRGECLGSHN